MINGVNIVNYSAWTHKTEKSNFEILEFRLVNQTITWYIFLS